MKKTTKIYYTTTVVSIEQKFLSESSENYEENERALNAEIAKKSQAYINRKSSIKAMLNENPVVKFKIPIYWVDVAVRLDKTTVRAETTT
jgi:hypothetical protein